jgi:hypothetical protein
MSFAEAHRKRRVPIAIQDMSICENTDRRKIAIPEKFHVRRCMDLSTTIHTISFIMPQVQGILLVIYVMVTTMTVLLLDGIILVIGTRFSEARR